MPLYGWDNEFGRHTAKVKNFEVRDKLVSNAEFFKFVIDKGYSRQEFWSAEGWKWASGSRSKFPKFWISLSEEGPPLEKS